MPLQFYKIKTMPLPSHSSSITPFLPLLPRFHRRQREATAAIRRSDDDAVFVRGGLSASAEGKPPQSQTTPRQGRRLPWRGRAEVGGGHSARRATRSPASPTTSSPPRRGPGGRAAPHRPGPRAEQRGRLNQPRRRCGRRCRSRCHHDTFGDPGSGIRLHRLAREDPGPRRCGPTLSMAKVRLSSPFQTPPPPGGGGGGGGGGEGAWPPPPPPAPLRHGNHGL